MTEQVPDDTAAVIQRLAEIKDRRAKAPKKDEIQAAIEAGLAAGLTVSDVAELTGIPRQQFYQGKYDLTSNRLARKHEPPQRRTT